MEAVKDPHTEYSRRSLCTPCGRWLPGRLQPPLDTAGHLWRPGSWWSLTQCRCWVGEGWGPPHHHCLQTKATEIETTEHRGGKREPWTTRERVMVTEWEAEVVRLGQRGWGTWEGPWVAWPTRKSHKAMPEAENTHLNPRLILGFMGTGGLATLRCKGLSLGRAGRGPVPTKGAVPTSPPPPPGESTANGPAPVLRAPP